METDSSRSRRYQLAMQAGLLDGRLGTSRERRGLRTDEKETSVYISVGAILLIILIVLLIIFVF